MLFMSLQVVVQALANPLLSCFFIHPKGVRADAIERHNGVQAVPEPALRISRQFHKRRLGERIRTRLNHKYAWSYS